MNSYELHLYWIGAAAVLVDVQYKGKAVNVLLIYVTCG